MCICTVKTDPFMLFVFQGRVAPVRSVPHYGPTLSGEAPAKPASPAKPQQTTLPAAPTQMGPLPLNSEGPATSGAIQPEITSSGNLQNALSSTQADSSTQEAMPADDAITTGETAKKDGDISINRVKAQESSQKDPPLDASMEEIVASNDEQNNATQESGHDASPQSKGEAAEEVVSASVNETSQQEATKAAAAPATENSRQERGSPDAHQQLRRRNLDAVGVIPGGRAAFGAVTPSAAAAATAPGAKTSVRLAPARRAADSGGVVPGGRTAFGAPQSTPARAPAANALLLPLGGGSGPPQAAASGGSIGSSGRIAGTLQPGTRLRMQFGGVGLRRLAADPRPYRFGADICDVLRTYDSLWHGCGSVVGELRQLASHS